MPSRRNGVGFPFNIRTLVNSWNFLYREAESAPASQGQSPAWQRGRYLVDVPGHRGDCHSPRGTLGQVDPARALTGNASLGRARGAGHHAGHPRRAAGTRANSTRISPAASPRAAAASGEMATVVALSTSRLAADDRAAMIAYLLGDAPPAARVRVAETDAALAPGRAHYLDLCAGRGAQGQGVPHVAVALARTAPCRDADPHNLIVTILDGLPEHAYGGVERMQERCRAAPAIFPTPTSRRSRTGCVCAGAARSPLSTRRPSASCAAPRRHRTDAQRRTAAAAIRGWHGMLHSNGTFRQFACRTQTDRYGL